jgi:hypothetical protein
VRLLLTVGDFALQMHAGGGRAMAAGPKRPERRLQTLLIVLYIDRICVFRFDLFRMVNGLSPSSTPTSHEPMGRV